MKAIFFDVGDTLEAGGVLVSRARETLIDIQALRDKQGNPPQVGLISDFLPAPPNPVDLSALQQQYYAILDGLGIPSFFEPVSGYTTLSTEVGVKKRRKRSFARRSTSCRHRRPWPLLTHRSSPRMPTMCRP